MSRIQNLGSNAKKRPSVTIEDVEDEGKPYNPSPSPSNDPGLPRIACLDDVPLLQIIWYGI
jgi:hypothetical protein